MKLFPISFAVSPVGKPVNVSAHCSTSGPFLQQSTGNAEPSPGHSLSGMGLLMGGGALSPAPSLSQGSKWKSFLLGVPPGGMKAAGNVCAPLLLSTSCSLSLTCLEALWAAAGWIKATLSSQLSPIPWSLYRINTGQALQHSWKAPLCPHWTVSKLILHQIFSSKCSAGLPHPPAGWGCGEINTVVLVHFLRKQGHVCPSSVTNPGEKDPFLRSSGNTQWCRKEQRRSYC